MSEDSEHISWIDVAMAGDKLPPVEVDALERLVENDPQDVESRVKLLGAYFLKRTPSGEEGPQERHIVWLIANRPEHPIAGTPFAGLFPPNERYQEASRLWQEHAGKMDASPAVLMNAAHFFMVVEKGLAEEYLLRGKALEPGVAQWRSTLALLYGLQQSDVKHSVLVDLAKKALAELAGIDDVDGEKRFHGLCERVRLAFDAQEFELAEDTALQALREAENFHDNWDYGNAIHDGNETLGLLALHRGDLEAAKKHLLEAGNTPGSPQLDTGGPELRLAEALFKFGERDVVLEYLRRCSKFCEEGKMEKLIAKIERGEEPEWYCG